MAWERRCFLPEQNPTKIGRATQRDPIGRHIAIWRIWLVDCSVTYLVYGLFRSAEVGQKSCFERVVLDAPYLGQFLSDFVRVKSNVSPRPSTFTYPIFEKSDFWPNYPFNLHVPDRRLKWLLSIVRVCWHVCLRKKTWTKFDRGNWILSLYGHQ